MTDFISHLTRDKIYLYLFRALAIASPLVLWLYRDDMLLSMSVSRNFAFRILVNILVLLYVLLFIHNSNYRPRLSWSLVLLIGVWFLYLISSLINNSFLWSFWGDYTRMDGLLAMGHLIAYWYVLSQVFREEREWHWYWQVIIFVGFGSGLVALSQALGRPLFIESSGGLRSTSLFGNAAYYSFFQLTAIFITFIIARQKRHTGYSFLLTMMIVSLIALFTYELFSQLIWHQAGPLVTIVGNIYMLCISLLLLLYATLYHFQRREYQRRLLFTLLLLVQIMGLVASLSKGPIIALFAGLGIAGLTEILRWRRSVWLRGVACLGLLLGAVFSGLVLYSLILGQSWNWDARITIEKITKSVSSEQRQEVWVAAEQSFSQKSIIGWGLNNFDYAFEKNYPERIYDAFNSPLWYDKAHNLLWQHAVEGGLSVMILGMIFLWLTFKHVLVWLRRTRQESMLSLWIGFLVSYSLVSLVYFDTLNNALLCVAVLAWIESQWRNQEQKRTYGLPISLGIRTTVLTVMLILITGLFIYNFHWRSWQANRLATTIFKNLRQDITTVSALELDKLEHIINQSPTLGKSDLRSQYATLVGEYTLQAADNREQLPLYIERAQIHLQKNIQKRPFLSRAAVEAMNFDLLAGRIDSRYWDQGQALAIQTLEMYPERIQLLYLVGRFYILRGHATDGLAFFARATERRPDIFDTHFNYYKQIATLLSDQDVEAYFETYLKPFSLADIFEVVKFDLAIQRADRALAHLQAIETSELRETSDELWRLYSLAYFQLDDLTRSQQAAQLALIINPDLLIFFQSYLGPYVLDLE